MNESISIRNKIASLQAELAKMETLENMIQGIPSPEWVVTGGHLAEFTLYYGVFTLDQAQEIISTIWNSKTVDVLSLSMCRDGQTVSFLTSYHGRAGEIKNIFPVVVHVDKWHLEFSFYGLMNDTLMRFCIRFDSGFSGYACVRYSQKQPWHHVKAAHLEHSAFEKPSYIRWASGTATNPPSFTMYWEDIKSLDEMFVR